MLPETERMIIRDFTINDVNDLYEILGDEETMRYSEPAYTLEQTKNFLKEFCIDRKGAAAAAIKDTGKVIGYILFAQIEDGTYELGWFFNKKYWSQGYAYEAGKAMINYAFAEKKAQKVCSETIDLEKSVKLMEKLGMKPEGILRKSVKDNSGTLVDLYSYAVTAFP